MFVSKLTSILLGFASTLGLAVAAPPAQAQAQAAAAASFTNPLRNPGGGDPQISYFDGYYYLISTEWTNLQLSRATTIEGLKTAVPKVIYSDTNASRCCNVWAPEIHYFEGRWYLYYTAGKAENLDEQRMHALRGESSLFFSFLLVYNKILISCLY